MKAMQIGQFMKINKNYLFYLDGEDLVIFAHQRPVFVVTSVNRNKLAKTAKADELEEIDAEMFKHWIAGLQADENYKLKNQ